MSLTSNTFSDSSVILVILLGGITLMVIFQYGLYLLPLAFFKKFRLEESEPDFPVSIIVCAKNEEKNLKEFLPRLLTQDYPDYEVVVVNDGSEDGTERLLNQFRQQYPHLKVVHFHPDAYYKHGKKMALLVGIKTARHEHLLFTDADCYPTGSRWVHEMAKGFTSQKKMIIGYSGYIKEKTFLNLLIRWDCFFHGVMYLSAVLRGKSYMGTGRNMAYVRTLFFQNKGFQGHYHLASGDDDLFIHQVSTPHNTNLCIHPDSLVMTPARTSFAGWKWQKARHISTSYYYKILPKLRLGFFYASLYAFYVVIIISFFNPATAWWGAISWFIKSACLWVFLKPSSGKLKENDLPLHSVYMEMIILVLYPYFHYLQKRFKPEQWMN